MATMMATMMAGGWGVVRRLGLVAAPLSRRPAAQPLVASRAEDLHGDVVVGVEAEALDHDPLARDHRPRGVDHRVVVAPGFYTMVVSDTAGAVLYSVIEGTY